MTPVARLRLFSRKEGMKKSGSKISNHKKIKNKINSNWKIITKFGIKINEKNN